MLMRLSDLKQKTGERSSATVYSNIREGLFTQPVRIGKRAVGWPDFEVDAINAARIEGKSPTEIKDLVKLLHGMRKGMLGAVLAKCMQERVVEVEPARASHGPKLIGG